MPILFVVIELAIKQFARILRELAILVATFAIVLIWTNRIARGTSCQIATLHASGTSTHRRGSSNCAA